MHDPDQHNPAEVTDEQMDALHQISHDLETDLPARSGTKYYATKTLPTRRQYKKVFSNPVPGKVKLRN